MDGAPALTWLPAMERALAGVPAAASSAQLPRLWLDVGTSEKTLAKWDVLHNNSLIVVGVDPVLANIEHPSQPATPRFVRIHGACADAPPGNTTLFAHRSPTCASLLPTRSNAPKLGKGRDACTGDVPTVVTVPMFPLRLLLRRMQRLARRVELLKIDVQGSELSCLRSAGAELRHVDNVLLEVQDADASSGLLMYEGAPSIGELDGLLGGHGLRRQYCEFNQISKQVREINCLYARSERRARRLWASGNFQRGGSMVSYASMPRFVRQPQFLTSLRTSADAGARLHQRPWSLSWPFVAPLEAMP